MIGFMFFRLVPDKHEYTTNHSSN